MAEDQEGLHKFPPPSFLSLMTFYKIKGKCLGKDIRTRFLSTANVYPGPFYVKMKFPPLIHIPVMLCKLCD